MYIRIHVHVYMYKCVYICDIFYVLSGVERLSCLQFNFCLLLTLSGSDYRLSSNISLTVSKFTSEMSLLPRKKCSVNYKVNQEALEIITKTMKFYNLIIEIDWIEKIYGNNIFIYLYIYWVELHGWQMKFWDTQNNRTLIFIENKYWVYKRKTLAEIHHPRYNYYWNLCAFFSSHFFLFF